GELPVQVVDLLNSVRLKWIAKSLGLERLILKKHKMIGYFVSNQQSSYYQTPVFTRVLQFVQQNASICTMKEKETKNGLRLLLTFDKITSVNKALATLQKI
uniref:TRCF domain-containing protein n=1 Tax=Lutibacter sp. TaxID=1925666 RepID=UPI003564CCE1